MFLTYMKIWINLSVSEFTSITCKNKNGFEGSWQDKIVHKWEHKNTNDTYKLNSKMSASQ